jgi:hypothetical protein
MSQNKIQKGVLLTFIDHTNSIKSGRITIEQLLCDRLILSIQNTKNHCNPTQIECVLAFSLLEIA